MIILTPGDARVLMSIARYWDAHGFAPSLDDVAAGAGLCAKSAAYSHVKRLEARGLVAHGARLQRTLHVTEAGRVYVADCG